MSKFDLLKLELNVFQVLTKVTVESVANAGVSLSKFAGNEKDNVCK